MWYEEKMYLLIIMNDQNDEFCFKKLKIALIGPGGCGKSAIAVRFVLHIVPVKKETNKNILI